MSKELVIFVGPTRSSTTSLFRYLSQFGFFLSSIKKETNWLIENNIEEAGVESYFREFPSNQSDGLIYLEASPLYFIYPERIAAAVKFLAANDVKVTLVTVLREPASRFTSLINHIRLKRGAGDELSIADLVEKNIVCADGLLVDMWRQSQYSLNEKALYESCYAAILKRWQLALGDNFYKKFQVMFFESLVDDESSGDVIREFMRMNVGAACKLDTLPSLIHENRTRSVRNMRLQTYAMKINNLIEPLLNRRQRLRNFLRDVYYVLNEKKSDKTAANVVDREMLARINILLKRGNLGLEKQVLSARPVGRGAIWCAEISS